MKKRVAYIGLLYPLLYDYRHQAARTFNDLSSSPNPIIESPLGLMVFYDELLFLCRSICPNNMRNLPYVKFVDELYPNFDFADIKKHASEKEREIIINNDLSFDTIRKALNVNWNGLDIHTHGLKLGNAEIYATSNERNFLLDLYIFQKLQQLYNSNIEMITNSRYDLAPFNAGAQAEFIDRIIIPGVPNYVGTAGPYHECMEELRENKYLKDFRRWVIKQHSNIQRAEIAEMCTDVERNIEEVKNDVFKKYLDNNSRYSFFKSTSITILKTVGGLAISSISVIDALIGSINKGRKVHDVQSIRWQGFVMDSRDIMGVKK